MEKFTILEMFNYFLISENSKPKKIAPPLPPQQKV